MPFATAAVFRDCVGDTHVHAPVPTRRIIYGVGAIKSTAKARVSALRLMIKVHVTLNPTRPLSPLFGQEIRSLHCQCFQMKAQQGKLNWRWGRADDGHFSASTQLTGHLAVLGAIAFFYVRSAPCGSCKRADWPSVPTQLRRVCATFEVCNAVQVEQKYSLRRTASYLALCRLNAHNCQEGLWFYGHVALAGQK